MAWDPQNWLDLWGLWEFEIVGEFRLAFLLLLGITVYFCNKYNAPFQVMLILVALIGLGVSAIKVAADLLIYAYTVLGIALISYYLISKTFKRG